MSALHNLQSHVVCQPEMDGSGSSLRQASGVPNHDDSHYSGYLKLTLPVKLALLASSGQGQHGLLLLESESMVQAPQVATLNLNTLPGHEIQQLEEAM